MPLIQVTILEGRTTEMIAQMAAEVTNVVSRALNAPRESIRVAVYQVTADEWFIAGESVAQRKALAGGADAAPGTPIRPLRSPPSNDRSPNHGEE